VEPYIFRSYDIRGRYPDAIDENTAYLVGNYFGELCVGGKIIIGFDGRSSAMSLYDALCQGIIDSGSVPISIGLVPTPMVYFADKILQPEASIMITASHNPKEDNGFKMILDGESFFAEKIIELRDYVYNSAKKYRKSPIPKIEFHDIAEDYIKCILQDIEIDPSMKVIWDIGNGAAGNIMLDLIEKLPNHNLLINAKIDGSFPSRDPDPTVHANLAELAEMIRGKYYDLGIAFDGDADRVVFVTSKGNILYGDQAVCIFSEDILATLPGSIIIGEVKSSQILFDYVNDHGGKSLMHRTGHSAIKAKMKETGAILAGEMSGHIFFADKYYGYDDALYAGLRMIDLLSRKNTSLEDLYSKLPKAYNTPEIKIPIADDKKFAMVDEIKLHLKNIGREFIDIDGIRYSEGDSWWLVRASNTEAAINIRSEARTEEALVAIENDLREVLDLYGINIKF
jgi:phosphomannomutase